MQFFTSLLALSGIFGAFAAPAPVTPGPDARIGQIVPDNYIVVLKKSVSASQARAHASWADGLHASRIGRRDDTGLEGVKNKYNTVFKGYSGSFDEETIAVIEESPEVDYVEKDQIATTNVKVTQDNPPSW